jgi:microcin C transport system substrate-binding protein
MKSKIYILFLVLILCISVFFSCSKAPKQGNCPKFNADFVYENQPTDKETSAEDGGTGFKGDGWTTNNTYQLFGDANSVKGGMITTAMDNFPVTLRPIGKDVNMTFNVNANNLLYQHLLEFDNRTDEYIPCLATHWKISADNLTFKFRINPDARWADGTPVTAEDVVATWKLYTDEGILFPYFNSLMGTYEQPKAESKYILTVKSKENNWRQFLYFACSMYILPANYIGKMKGSEFLNCYQFDYIPGSGPYLINIKDVIKEKSISLVRRKNFWAEKEKFSTGKYNFDTIKFELITDENLTIQKFLNGEIDFLEIFRSSVWNEKLKTEETERGLAVKLMVYNFYPKGIQGLALNMRKEPFNDINIRKAMSFAYNRELFNEKFFFNSYFPIKSFFPGSKYENSSIQATGFNLDSSIKYLKLSGWIQKNSDGYFMKNGKLLEVKMLYSNPGQLRYYDRYKEDLKKAGIKLNLEQTDQSTILKLGNEKNFEMVPVRWEAEEIPNPEALLSSKTADDTMTNNWPGIKDLKLDSLTQQYNIATDKIKRMQLLNQIDSIAFGYYAYVFEWYAPFQRIVYQNKFSYPEWVLTIFGSPADIISLWYFDKTKSEAYQKARNDKSVKLSIPPLENKYWLNKISN